MRNPDLVFHVAHRGGKIVGDPEMHGYIRAAGLNTTGSILVAAELARA